MRPTAQDRPPSRQELLGEVRATVVDVEDWLDAPNDRLGGRPPRELLEGQEDERAVLHHMLVAVRAGFFT